MVVASWHSSYNICERLACLSPVRSSLSTSPADPARARRCRDLIRAHSPSRNRLHASHDRQHRQPNPSFFLRSASGSLRSPPQAASPPRDAESPTVTEPGLAHPQACPAKSWALTSVVGPGTLTLTTKTPTPTTTRLRSRTSSSSERALARTLWMTFAAPAWITSSVRPSLPSAKPRALPNRGTGKASPMTVLPRMPPLTEAHRRPGRRRSSSP